MYKSKLIHLFALLSASQRLGIRKWLQSPAHNQRADIWALWTYMEDQGPEAAPKAWEKAKVFEAIFGRTYRKEEDSLLRYAQSFLLQQIEEFLIAEQLDQMPLYKAELLAKAYQQIGLSKHLGQQTDKWERQLERQPQRASAYRKGQYALAKLRYKEEAKAGKSRNAPKNLPALGHWLDSEYRLRKLRQACLFLAHQAVYKTQYDFGLLPAVLAQIEAQTELLEDKALALYYHCYRLQSSVDAEEDFRELKRLLLSEKNILPDEQLRELYQLAINFCTKQVNLQRPGYEDYFEEMFALYRAGLNENLLLEQGLISPFAFKNIVSVGLWLKAYDWVANFIKDYENALPKAHQAAYARFSWAKLALEKEQYAKAQELLLQQEFADLFMQLNARVMLLKIYYALEEFDLLESFLASFRSFVNRKKRAQKLRSYHQENYLNIISFCRKLLQLNPYDRQEKKNLRQQIEDCSILTERRWFLQQL
ncbi:hypothetical protein PPO43_15810 [Saprospira sp. CCB-QB6]|uniref:hypothetical protein n=1 Tax=Saprospira sp. CCB-QB6 TaxID=3023936 RepID=UPI00234AACDB|nr:hypothetical protein [Saprospira sp. CCB-QB6]WCL81439.1 hypothetical protein PPO43_15810 [Saprospira sp. CCB-QB6]